MTQIRLENVHVAYGKRDIVRDVSFTVESGELAVLVGRSGSGKTSLLRAITGYAPVVAGFIGTPPMNFLAATIQPSANGHVDESPLTVVTTVFSLPLSARVISSGVHDHSRLVPGAALTLGVRPEDLIVGSPAGEDGPRGQVVVVEPQGDERIVSVALTGGDAVGTVWKVRAPKHGPSANIAVGDAVGLTVRSRGLRLFDEETEERVL